MRTLRRMLALAALTFALIVTMLPASAQAATATTALTAGQAEALVLAKLNAIRADRGLVAIRRDRKLANIAGDRSADMVRHGYFGHTEPDGDKVFDYLNRRGVNWLGAGEILAWNKGWPTLADSAQAAVDGWMGSDAHRAVVLSADYNYAGIGLATTSGGKRIWTGVFAKMPDHTGALGRMSSATELSFASTSATLRFTWTGADVQLQTLTAGLRNFWVQKRIDGGSWVTVSKATTSRSWSPTISRGHRVEVRVLARDQRGNLGPWSAPMAANS